MGVAGADDGGPRPDRPPALGILVEPLRRSNSPDRDPSDPGAPSSNDHGDVDVSPARTVFQY